MTLLHRPDLHGIRELASARIAAGLFGLSRSLARSRLVTRFNVNYTKVGDGLPRRSAGDRFVASDFDERPDRLHKSETNVRKKKSIELETQ